MRLFVAIEIGEAARAAIRDTQRSLASALGHDASALRFVRPEQLHLTLVFLGEVGPGRVPALLEALRPEFGQPAYTLTLGGAGVFPSGRAPRALWLGVTGGADATIALQADVARRLGLPADGPARKAFTPHVTLARWRTEGRRRTLPPVDTALASVRVASVTLFESRLSNAGPAYTALLRTGLTCR